MYSVLCTFIVILLCSYASAQNSKPQSTASAESIDNHHSLEQFRQIEIGDLLKSLEHRIDEAISETASDKEIGKNDGEHLKNTHLVTDAKQRLDQNAKTLGAQFNLGSRNRLDETKISKNDDILSEFLKEFSDMDDQTILPVNPSKRNYLKGLEEEEPYYRMLLRLQSLQKERRQHDDRAGDGRTIRTATALDKRLEQVESKLQGLLEKRRAAKALASTAKRYVVPSEVSKEPDAEARSQLVMDTAIAEADDIVLQLSQEMSSRAAPGDEDADRRALGLAIDLVNKIMVALSGDADNKYGLLDSATGRQAGLEDYLKAPAPEPDEPLSNAGFDFLDQDGAEGQNDYVGHPGPFSRGRCNSCAGGTGETGQQVFQGRDKRLTDQGNRGQIYHLQQAVQRSRSGGVWRDVNKLYNFKDLEHDKYLNLSMNCTGDSPQPDCQRLQYVLVTPKDAEPVPLWFVQDHLSQGRDLAVDMLERARGLQTADGLHPALHSPSMLHFLNNRVSDSAIKLNEESQIVLFGTKVLREKLLTEYKLTPRTFVEFLDHHGFRVTGSKVCRARERRCSRFSKFRSIEGSCNNLNHPYWGQSNTAFVRILAARYSDGIHALATSASGGPLPNPRALSGRLFGRRNASDAALTLALVHWGQLLAHDFARQVIDQTVVGGVECCESRGRGPLPKALQHHSCSPIDIPVDDRFYARFNQTCMNFVRSMTVAREDCSLGPADQLNGVSSFLDLSPVYGSDRGASDSLREFRGGRMRTESRANRVMMPTSARSGFCDARTTSDVCYETGDARTNQNPQLVILQTLIVREHNRIASELSALNPHWTDERLFQESRHIVIAEYQHITYRHWLPLVLGKRYISEHKIFPQHNKLSSDYNERINPGIINSFTSAAFRFLHSMIEGSINLVAGDYGTTGRLRLSDHYFRPQIVEPGTNFESLLRGLVHQTMQKSDSNFHREISSYLFRSDNEYGMDLEAIDIQRGRDHGLPGYNAYREICQLGRANDFHGLINEISLGNIEKLQGMYEHVNDIDLLVGATLENRASGSLLGPTLQCLIGEQFYRSRVGDKYFYNNANYPHSFKPEKFEEIKKASLATFICDLGETTYQIQLNPFKVGSRNNPIISCFNFPRINLELWKE